MKKNRITIVILSCVMLISLLCACNKPANTGRISEEEMATLRAQYPYNDFVSEIASMVSADRLYPTFDALLGDNPWGIGSNFYAVVVVKIDAPWYTISKTVLPYDDPELNKLVLDKNPSIANVEWDVYDAKIEKILWGGDDLKKGDTVTIGFDSLISGYSLEKVFHSGQYYVCFLEDWRDAFSPINNALFATSTDHLFYLTKEDVIISVTSAPGADEASGLYLSSFTTLVNETLGPPDAEIGPVEPELETE